MGHASITQVDVDKERGKLILTRVWSDFLGFLWLFSLSWALKLFQDSGHSWAFICFSEWNDLLSLFNTEEETLANRKLCTLRINMKLYTSISPSEHQNHLMYCLQVNICHGMTFSDSEWTAGTLAHGVRLLFWLQWYQTCISMIWFLLEWYHIWILW